MIVQKPRRERIERATGRSTERATVGDAAASAIERGHPWVYATQLSGAVEGKKAGDAVLLFDRSGRALGWAIVEPGSPIVARVWSLDAERTIDEASIAERCERAMEVRDRLIDERTNALRLVHGEGDRAPGVVVDRYAHVAVLRLDGAAIEAWTDRIADAIFPALERRGVRSLVARTTERSAGSFAAARPSGALAAARPSGATRIRSLRGEPAPDVVEVREHGVPFVVDLARGQKTGAFLDQRENRRRVGALAKDRRVLNLFSYAGGFSLHAALGGARSVTSVDVAAGAHATAQRSFTLAGVALEPHDFVTADVWDFLERARSRGERWDLVISDPPSMAPSEAAKPRALAAYKKLHALGASVLEEGGVFCASSCSSHVPLEDFLGTLDDRTLQRRDLRVVEIAGAGSDHPTLPSFPEGRYLKFCVLA